MAGQGKPLLLKVLKEWTSLQPHKLAISYLDDRGDVTQGLTYIQLWIRSSQLANFLINNLQLKRGDRVLLVYPPSLDFLIAFIACLKVGIIAVPTFPPDPSKLNKDLRLFSSIVQTCGARVALTSSMYHYATKMAAVKNILGGESASWPELHWEVTDSILSVTRDEKSQLDDVFDELNFADSETTSNCVAFLQFTSGSTSEPKGVIITQGNLAHNLSLIIHGLSAVDDTIVVSWLPQYHDMGLIGSFLGVLYCGGSGYYMSPLSFIRNPVLWVSSISRYRGTHIQAPNFAYTLTARKFLVRSRSGSQVDQLDLSCVRHMINAGIVIVFQIKLQHSSFLLYFFFFQTKLKKERKEHDNNNKQNQTILISLYNLLCVHFKYLPVQNIQPNQLKHPPWIPFMQYLQPMVSNLE